jgi:hypothetical protein
MAYILDDKRNLGYIVIPNGPNDKITVFSEFEVKPQSATEPYFGIYNDGTINIGGPNSSNNLIIEAGVDFDFKQIFGLATNYNLTENDYAIEIMSDSYNTITLPTALNSGGRTYVLSRGSNNNNLVVKAQTGENIDSRQEIHLKRKNDHIKIYSNNIDSWYRV